MDVRAGVFDLIARDVVLRAIRVTHTDRERSDYSAARSGFGTCSITLEWAVNYQAGAPEGSHLLTVWAHLPRQRTNDLLFLDLLLQRVREVLLAGAADGSITGQYRGMSRHVVVNNFDTIAKSNTFQVAPGQRRYGQLAPLRLARWEGAERDAARFGARSGAAQTLN